MGEFAGLTGRPRGRVAIIGAGFVADLYMRSLQTFPEISVSAVYDIDAARLETFCTHWNAPKAESLDAALNGASPPDLVLNLTNPHAHFAVSKAALEAGRHVYSEKPLATAMSDAHELHAIAEGRGLILASAPCSWLSEAAQTLWAAVSCGAVGAPRLIYAELDDDFIPQAPYTDWKSESGAPWPAEDEFKVGCTLEHAGYYLTWLMAIFGPVRSVTSASADIIPGKLPTVEAVAPDFSTAVLFFQSGVVARLTCSIVAPHDHRIRIIGDEGVIELEECWDNAAVVKIRKRHVLRRKLINSPIARRFSVDGAAHPKVGRWGAAAMNFALGPAEILGAITTGKTPKLNADFALHLNEVTLAIQEAGEVSSSQTMETSFAPITPPRFAASGGAKPANIEETAW